MFGFDKKSHLNVPNILSFYRILSFPFVLYLILTNRENAFVIFLIINLITDILDGAIARMFNMQTEFGARLDSIADDGTIVLAITGILFFKLNDFSPHLFSFLLFLFFYLLTIIISMIKFKRLASFHLYSAKIAAYIQGVFFIVLFVFDFYPLFYYFMIIWGIASFMENIIIQVMEPELISNAKGLYWVLKNR